MITFNMSIKENFASFKDPSSDTFVFVESFDNSEFDVRVGTITDSNHVGTIRANSDKDLNSKLSNILLKV